jgi:biotin operon repressor
MKLQLTYKDDVLEVGVYLSPDFLCSPDFSNLQGNALKVMLVLLKHMSHTDFTCFPTLEQIADSTGLSKPCVLSCISQLKNMGVITKVTQSKSKYNPQLKHNTYHMNKAHFEVVTVEHLEFIGAMPEVTEADIVDEVMEEDEELAS